MAISTTFHMASRLGFEAFIIGSKFLFILPS